MQDRPSARDLLAAARAFLQEEITPALSDPRLRFRALIAANVLDIVARELTGEMERLRAQWRRLAALGVVADAAEPPATPDDLRAAIDAGQRTLCRRIQAGEADAGPSHAAVLAYIRWSVEAKLQVSNPRFLDRFTRLPTVEQ